MSPPDEPRPDLRPWSARIVLLEALANIGARAFRHVLITLALVIVMTMTAYVEIREVSQLLQEQRDQIAAGSRVLVIEAASPLSEGAVPRGLCDYLDTLDHTIAAGGWQRHQTVTIPAAPSTPMIGYIGSGRIARVVDPSYPAASLSDAAVKPDGRIEPAAERRLQILVGAVAADQIGLARAGMIDLDDQTTVDTDQSEAGTITVWAERLSVEDRFPAGNTMIMRVGAPPTVTQCWLEITPGIEMTDALAVTTFLAGTATWTLDNGSSTDEPVSLSVRPLRGAQRDVLAAFTSRPTRVLPGIGALMSGTLVLIHTLAARRELPLYRTLGSGRLQAIAIATIEALVTLTMAAAGAAVLSVWLAKGPALASARGLALIAFSASVAALASMIANALLASRPMWSQLKDRGA